MSGRRATWSAGDGKVVVDLDQGCRLASLRIGGHELLVTGGPTPIEWGLYPMAPFAGRVRNGRFDFDGHSHELPRTLGGHAIHGTVYVQEWDREDETTFVTDLVPPWPYAGFVRQSFDLRTDSLALRLEVHTDEEAMPAACGWHPWFRRTAGGGLLRLDFRPGFMLARDAEGIATRRRVGVPPGPWDDCFGDVAGPPELNWPKFLSLSLTSDCDWWVVYNERDYAVCVEPQTAPPDALNHHPSIVRPGQPLVANLQLHWRRHE